MKLKTFIILLFISVLVGSALSFLYSRLVISSPQDNLRDYRRTFYLKSDQRVTTTLNLSYDSYLLKIKHPIQENYPQEIYLNGINLAPEIFYHRIKKGTLDTVYIHLPKRIVKEGKNDLEIVFPENHPPHVGIILSNYHKKFDDSFYVFFPDSVSLDYQRISFKNLILSIILVFSLLTTMVYLLNNAFSLNISKLFLYQVYSLIPFFVFSFSLYASSYINRLYRLVITPNVFSSLGLGTFIITNAYLIGRKKYRIKESYLLLKEKSISWKVILAITFICLGAMWVLNYGFVDNLILICAIYFITFLLICLYITNNKLRNGMLYTIFFITTFPLIGIPIMTGLDSSWVYAINYIASKHIQFGKDVIFTYGPLGFLMTTNPLGNNLLISTIFGFINHAILIYAIISLVLPYLKERILRSCLSLAAIASFIGSSPIDPTVNFFLVVAILILSHNKSGKNIYLYIASFYVALAVFIKFGLAIECAAILFSYMVVIFFNNKNIKLLLSIIATIIISLLSLWYILYHNFESLAGYVSSNIQLVHGNSSAMASAMTNFQENSWNFMILGAIIIIGVVYLLRDRNIYFTFLIFLLPAIIFFKYATIRIDGHELIFLKFLEIFYCFILIQQVSYKKTVVFSVFFLISFLLFFSNFVVLNRAFGADFVLTFEGHSIDRIYNLFTYRSYEKKLIEMSERNLKSNVLPKKILDRIGQSGVDIYPNEISYIPANNLNWILRPVFQSYLAYTPWLDNVNRNFIATNKASRFIIWHGGGNSAQQENNSMYIFEEKYLLNDEPNTMYSLLDNYKPILYDDNVILFERKNKPTFSDVTLSSSYSYGWNHWIEVPPLENNIIRARIYFNKTVFGNVKRLLHKQDAVFIEYKFKNGNMVKHRLVIDNALSGVWVSPYITNFSYVLKNIDGSIDINIAKENKDNLFFGYAVSQIRLTCNDKNAFMPNFSIIWEKNKAYIE